MGTKKNKSKKKPSVLEKMSTTITRASGSSAAFIIALSVIVAWLVSGPIFHFSDTWQLVINTGTTIITFLMVFLIQRAQNKDSIALHLKLNELIVAQELASNRMVAVEEISEEDLIVLKMFYKHLSDLAQKEALVEVTHSIKQATGHHKRKLKTPK